MQVKRLPSALAVTLEGAEVELFRLALKRATFEDTPPERQREILSFSLDLLRAIDEDPAQTV